MLSDHLSFIGDLGLLDAPRFVILNSRQSKRPCGRDAWVRMTAQVVKARVESGRVAVTSVGLNTWELVTYLVNVKGGKQIIVLAENEPLPVDCLVTELVRDFRLDRGRCLFAILDEQKLGKSTWPKRDEACVCLAETLVPVSVREGGVMSALLHAAEQGGKRVDHEFSVPYARAVDRARYTLDQEALDSNLDPAGWHFLTHWTRTASGPFPGETRNEFYSDIVCSASYPRSAFAALRHILKTATIRASDRFIRGGHRVVSLTELAPVDAVSLMRWRRRYVGYSFEPYGIAIEKEYALSVGFRPVLYGDDNFFEELTAGDQPFYQKSGSPVADWLPEKEWRFLGDLNLQSLDPDKIRAITCTPAEAAMLRSFVPFQVLSLLREER